MWLDVVMEQLLEKVCESESRGVVETSALLPVITRGERGNWNKGSDPWLKASLTSTRQSILKGW